MKKWIFILLFISVPASAIVFREAIFFRIETYQIAKKKEAIRQIPQIGYQPVSKEEIKTEEEKTFSQADFLASLDEPEEAIMMDVPFVCQNPFMDSAHWDTHDESCEEAALLQVQLFYKQASMTNQEAHNEILKMIDWQKQYFGSHKDLYGEEMKDFIVKYYEYEEDEVLYLADFNQELLQKLITSGYPIIVPVNGLSIGNPFYPHPGYHMLTVVGYNQNMVITNDVGTKRGEQYPYAYDTFFQANSDEGGGAFVILKRE